MQAPTAETKVSDEAARPRRRYATRVELGRRVAKGASAALSRLDVGVRGANVHCGEAVVEAHQTQAASREKGERRGSV